AWLTELLVYVEENMELVIKELYDTKLSVMRPEGTYLVWIDCSAYREEGNFAKVLLEKAHVRVSEGIFFGKSGEHFIRLNVACPRRILKEALGRIKRAVAE
ncbi:MAG: aminotransferase class I/II-fold pyridoxal phosphate-dependent enzyme, partial [Lachnospiraceae bacterium]|nr:aminotransferase class I/II-fold pyridoxal phosphate-dependent enzyme [Lachnospiraceae bacterium]